MPDTEYYAILNVGRTASAEEITRKYRSLAQSLHPDRQPADLKESANEQFKRLGEAYQVLSDAKRRRVYDALGKEGLNQDWALVRADTSIQELRDELERESRKQNEAKVDRLVRARSETTMSIDSRPLFSRRLGDVGLGLRWSAVRQTQHALKASYSIPFGLTSVTIQSQMASSMIQRRAQMGFDTSLVVKRPLNAQWAVQTEASLTNWGVAKSSLVYDSGAASTMSFGTVWRGILSPPEVNVSLKRALFGGLVSTFDFKSGPFLWSFDGGLINSTLAYGLITPGGLVTEVATNPIRGQSFVAQKTWLLGSGSAAQKISHGLSVVLGTSINASGISFIGSFSRRVTQLVKAGLVIELNLAGIITFKCTVSRLGHQISVPVLIFGGEEISLVAALTTVGVPVSAIFASHYLYFERKQKLSSKSNAKILQREYADESSQAHNRALETQNLLRATADASRASEQAKNGLVVLAAHYGTRDAQDAFDVKIPVQALVYKSALVIPGRISKNHTPGFYDPALGEPKVLTVDYLFRDRLHSVSVGELDTLVAPLEAHLVN